MKYFLGFFLLILTVFPAFAQDSQVYQIENVNTGIKVKNGKITREVIFDPSEKKWWVSDQQGTILVHHGFYADAALKIKDGEHQYFYDNGDRKLEINFKKGIKDGLAFKFKEFVFLPPDTIFLYVNNKPILLRKIINYKDYFFVMDSLKIPGFELEDPKTLDEPTPPPPPVEEPMAPYENKIYIKVEIEPGIKISFKQLLKENLKYPKKAKRKKTEGIVRIAFIVEKDGQLSDLQFEKESSTTQNQELIAEAIRLVQLSSGKWNPSIQNGTRVKAYFTASIPFFLDGSLDKAWPR